MADQQQLIVDLKLRDQLTGPLAAAKSGVTGLEAEAAKLSGTAQKAGASFGGLTSSITGFAKAGASAFVAFQALNAAQDFFAGAISGAREEEVGIARLSASLKANVTAWDGNTAAIEKTIAAREDLAFSDGDLRDSLGSLVAVTHDVNKALDIQNVAMDLARFKGVSLQEATQALVTVEAGRYRGLAQLGIVLQQGATQVEALAAVERVAGGQAQAFADTTQGAFDRLNIKIHDLQENVGGPLADAFSTLIETGENTADFVDTLAKKLQQGRDSARGFGDGTVLASPQVAALGTVVDTLVVSLRDQVRWSLAGRDAIDIWGAGIGKAASDDLPGLVEKGKEAEQSAAALVATMQTGSVSFRSFTTDAGETGAGLDNIAAQARAAAQGLDVTHGSATGLKDALDSLPREIDIDVNLRLFGSGAGALGVGFAGSVAGNTDNSPTLGSTGSLAGTSADPAELARRALAAQNAASSAADAAAAKAKQRAEELARIYRDKVDREFQNAESTAKSLFNSLHDRHIQAIKDAETLARTNHDAAVEKIQDDLKAQQTANAQPVTAAEAALQAVQDARRLRDLQAAVNEAFTSLQQNADPTKQGDLETSLRNARESLSDFQAQQNIERLKATQTGADSAAQAEANRKTAEQDAALAKAERQARLDTAAENTRNTQTIAQFERQLAALKVDDLKAKKSPADTQKDIDALQSRFGIFTDAQGFHHIQDPLVQAIKQVKIPTPTFIQHITYTTPPIFINGRQVAAATAQQVNVTQSTTVRGGQQRPS